MRGGMTVKEAAIRSGSCTQYVIAAEVLLRAVRQGWANQTWINQVKRGEVPLLKAAEIVGAQVRLVDAYRTAEKSHPMVLRVFFAITGCTRDLATHILGSTPEQCVKAAEKVGVNKIWDSMINPLLQPAE
jgi:hypothetical protein